MANLGIWDQNTEQLLISFEVYVMDIDTMVISRIWGQNIIILATIDASAVPRLPARPPGTRSSLYHCHSLLLHSLVALQEGSYVIRASLSLSLYIYTYIAFLRTLFLADLQALYRQQRPIVSPRNQTQA